MDQSKIQSLQPALDAVVSKIRQGEIILWAGSGLSLYAGYPSAKALCEKIIGAVPLKDDNHRARLLTYQNSLADLSNEFSQMYSREALINILKECYDANPTVQPNTHYLISKIPQIHTIITTNYDHLFELVYGEDIQTFVGSTFKRSCGKKVDLYKIHGDTSDPDSIILTSLDYAQFHNNLTTILWGKIISLIADKSILFVGYSLEDKNIQDLMKTIVEQIGGQANQFFFVSPESIPDYKLQYYNNFCKTTHIQLCGEDFFEYAYSKIKENILIDAIDKKIDSDEAYSICIKSGIIPTITYTPNGDTTKIEISNFELSEQAKVAIAPEAKAIYPSSSSEVQAIKHFLTDSNDSCLELPTKNLIICKNINGIDVPLHKALKPDLLRLTRLYVPQKALLRIAEYSELTCQCVIKRSSNNSPLNVIIELPSITIDIRYSDESTSWSFAFRYPHTSNTALQDMKRLKLLAEGKQFVFTIAEKSYILPPLDDDAEIRKLLAYINPWLQFLPKLQSFEKHFRCNFVIDSEFTSQEMRYIYQAYTCLSPQKVPFRETISMNVGKISLNKLNQYMKLLAFTNLELTSPDILVEDTFSIKGKLFTLGQRKYTLIEPYITNYPEAATSINTNDDVILSCASRQQRAMLEFIPITHQK